MNRISSERHLTFQAVLLQQDTKQTAARRIRCGAVHILVITRRVFVELYTLERQCSQKERSNEGLSSATFSTEPYSKGVFVYIHKYFVWKGHSLRNYNQVQSLVS